jgi:hypothetical protein
MPPGDWRVLISAAPQSQSACYTFGIPPRLSPVFRRLT